MLAAMPAVKSRSRPLLGACCITTCWEIRPRDALTYIEFSELLPESLPRLATRRFEPSRAEIEDDDMIVDLQMKWLKMLLGDSSGADVS